MKRTGICFSARALRSVGTTTFSPMMKCSSTSSSQLMAATTRSSILSSMLTTSTLRNYCSKPPSSQKKEDDAEIKFENPYEKMVDPEVAEKLQQEIDVEAEARKEAALQAEAESKLSEEEKESIKDEKVLDNSGKLLVFAAFCAGVIYFASDYARGLYYGREGSTKVNVETRGRPSLGGPFTLVTTKGEPVNQAIFLGQWTFFYFGFTHCPEICPIELNRMSKVVDDVRKEQPDEKIVPLFVSCDPRRDSLESIEEYLSVFHPDFVGLVGTPNQVNEACKSYRIYYSIPDDKAMQEEDYLIDHSIAIFLFDPNGKFVDFFGNRYDESEITKKVLGYMEKLKKDPEWTNW